MLTIPPALQSILEPWLLFLAEDPLLRLLQGGMLLVGAIVVFLVFFTTRDILLRTNSFLYMFVSIVLVAALPVVGFFLYLLIRPASTLRERELRRLLEQLLRQQRGGSESKKGEKPGKQKQQSK